MNGVGWPPRPLDHLALSGRPDDPALEAGGTLLSYAGLDDKAGRLAHILLRAGMRPGDRVASWMGKTLAACLMPLAAARAGLVHVPINPVLKRAQAAHILADSGARLVIGNAERLATLSEGASDGARRLPLEQLDWSVDPLPASSADPESLAALFYTSGSTGRPKGVMLSHANLWLGAQSVAHYLALRPDDRTLCVLPLAFDYGQNQLLSAWASGGAAMAFDYLLPRDLVREVVRSRATVLAGVPPLWLQLAEARWPDGGAPGLRILTNSGGHLPESVFRRLRALLPAARIHLMYGLTEAFRSTSLDPALADRHPDSIGVAIPNAEVLVVGPDGRPVQPGEEGELVHAGPLVAKGYWGDPERTRERFRPAPSAARSGGTAVWSGDRVALGTDGLLRFVGRDDTMIKVSGNRVSPTEVEEAAMASGAVANALALGVPDDRLGQAIHLVAVARGPEGEAEARLRAYLAAELPAFMQPRTISWRDRMPLSPNGKIDRAAIARSAA